MAVHSMTVAQILSRVRQAIPDAKETYVMNLVNDALVEAGMWNTKMDTQLIDAVEDQRWYAIGDDTTYDLNKVTRVDFIDSNGDYIQIPRLLNNEVQVFDGS